MENAAAAMEQPCAMCPRACGARRSAAPGRCHGGAAARICAAAPHFFEEPCISGTRGSGAVFFSGCPLGCVFCQNHAISRGVAGREADAGELAAVFLQLQAQGVHNLNLVTPTHYRAQILEALAAAKAQGLRVPVVWNTGGYETADAAGALAGAVDIYLTDVKYHSAALSQQLCGARDYFDHAMRFAQDACRAAGPPVFDGAGLLQRGVVVRVLALPGHTDDTVDILHALAEALPKGGFLLSLMRQYTPPENDGHLPRELRRPLASYEYRRVCGAALDLGLENGYFQQKGSVGRAYVPDFDV